MLTISKLFENAYKTMYSRSWDKIYVMVDIHGTILVNNYTGLASTAYPDAINALQMLSLRKDVVLILYSSCHQKDYEYYIEKFKSLNINFQYFNNNPEIENTSVGCFTTKPYFSILLDDKAGFDPDMDWSELIEYLNAKG